MKTKANFTVKFCRLRLGLTIKGNYFRREPSQDFVRRMQHSLSAVIVLPKMHSPTCNRKETSDKCKSRTFPKLAGILRAKTDRDNPKQTEQEITTMKCMI